MADKTLIEIRKFLNKKGYHTTASIYALLQKTTYKRKGKSDGLFYSAELKLSDCDRFINLSIDTECKSSIKNSLYKLDNLISTLQIFRDVYKEEMEKYLQYEKQNKGDTDICVID